MDVSVKKLSEILKIDPEAFLKNDSSWSSTKMLKMQFLMKIQILLSFIRKSKSSPESDEPQKSVVTPKLSPAPAPIPPKTKAKAKPVKPKDETSEKPQETKIKSVNINGSIRVNDPSRKSTKEEMRL